MTQNWTGPCACLGPMHGEPYCHCLMERHGMPRSHAYQVEQERIQRELPAALEALFAKRPQKEGA